MSSPDPSSRTSPHCDADAEPGAAALAVPVPPVPAEATCAAALRLFEGMRHGQDAAALPVVDRDGAPLGLVGRAAVEAAPPALPVTRVMEEPVLLVDGSLTLEDVARRVARAEPAGGLFLVVDGQGRCLGTATTAGLLAALADQSDHRLVQLAEARRATERAVKRKTAFLANMSHEIRTPLNAMMGFAELLEQEVLGPHAVPLYRDYAHDIAESGRHLMELINDLLDLSKAEAERLVLHEGVVDVPRTAAVCARLLTERAGRAQVRIAVAVPESLPPLHADERKLRQMLLNLLSNAVKFTPAGGTVLLTGRLPEAGGLELSVQDTGIGMSDQELAKALEPWGQIDSALSRRHVGTGLGLPLTKRLIELHGGSLAIVSNPGQGTTTTLSFPPDRVLRV